MKIFLTIWTLIFIHFNCQSQNTQTPTSPLHPKKYQRHDKHDGYVIGNGQMYLIAGLGKELERKGKSQITQTPVDYTRIAWVIGPTYPVGNLGYGWEIIPILNGDTLEWNNQEVLSPDQNYQFWGIKSHAEQLQIINTDILLSSETVFIRAIEVRKPENAKSGKVQLLLPVFADPRNGYYGMYNGSEVDSAAVARFKKYCGPNLKARTSISPERQKLVNPQDKSITLVGANHALWQEVSTIVPPDSVYAQLFPYRAAATSIRSEQKEIKVQAKESGFLVDLGEMKANDVRTLYLYIVTEKGSNNDIEQKTNAKLQEWLQKDITTIINQQIFNQPDFLYRTMENEPQPLIRSINSSLNLSLACKPNGGGVMAQPYMYPMYYVRDQFGSFKLLLAAAEYQKAYEILAFYIAKQNIDGIQNAHDLFASVYDPAYWHPEANDKDGHHAIAEVPSYIILMASEYYKATGDLEAIAPFYERLKYNLHVQKPSVNGILPYPGDESYTNFSWTRPKFSNEMTDSQLLFLSAASFMAILAEKLEKNEDRATFDSLYHYSKEQLFERLWLEDEKYFAYTRDASFNEENIDKRPAFDALLRWFFLELESPLDSVAQGNLQTLLAELTDPIRVVPEYEWATGMELGYLLYALARSQHPLTHDAAKLLLRYASDQGLYSEYYSYKGDSIISEGGTLRPWESSINGYALIQYLSGLRIDLPNNKIFLQPHLPPEWNGWSTKRIPLYQEGSIQLGLRKMEDEVHFKITRSGGQNTIQLELEFGLFGNKLSPVDENLKYGNSKKDLLISATEIPVGKTENVLVFKFKTD